MPSSSSSRQSSIFGRDLESRKWIFAKGFGFLLIIAMSFGVLIFEELRWRRALVGLILIWSSARFYYFLFYVIERYVDSEFKFAGLWPALKYLIRSRSQD